MSDGSDGVYATDRDGRPVLVHEYLNENYGLGDVSEMLQLGRLSESDDEALTLALSRKEITDLKNLADAFSFDYDEGFIEMCLDIHRFAAEAVGETLVFVEKA
jgi:hypothetical protein